MSSKPGIFPLSPLYTDLYELTMAQGFFLSGKHREPSVFDLHYRNNPFKGGYVIAAGLDEVAALLESFRFQPDDLRYLEKQGFGRSFLRFLSRFRFNLRMDAVREGEVVFPHEPLARIEGNLLECQLAETILINRVHFSSLVATKASRIVSAARGRSVVDFGLRRSQALAGLTASRCAYIGGVNGTSNVLAGKEYGVPVFGTQAHSWVQAWRDEKKSFLEFARIHRGETVLLIDTYNTLESGLPHLLQALKVLKKEKIEIRGVRIDSGDLAYLSKRVREVLDREGFPGVKIFASGQLDEYIIESLLSQGARIDGFGVGTKLATCFDEPALDMVYKLCSIGGHAEIKISDNLAKMNEPGRKKIRRFYSGHGDFFLDAVVLDDEKEIQSVMHPVFELASTSVRGLAWEDLFQPLMRRGKVARRPPSAEESRTYAAERLARLPAEHKRFYYPHVYRVGVSPKLFRLKQKLIARRLGKKSLPGKKERV